MTSPNLSSPPDGTANHGSFAAWAAKDEAAWRATLTGAESARWDEIRNGLFDGFEDIVEAVEGGMTQAHAMLTALARRLTGNLTITFPTAAEALAAIAQIPILGDFIELITGVEDGDYDDLGTFFLNWRRFFEVVDFTDPDFDPEATRKLFVELVVQPLIKSITRITSALLGPLSIGFLTDEIQTLLFEGGFDDPVTIVPGDGVEHDATDGVPLTTPLGCAKVTCDGTDKSRATEVIKVAPGWALKLGGRIKYEGLTAGADAIRLNLIPYSDASTPVPGGAIMVATAGTVSGTSTGVNGWGLLPIEGSWTVPATGVSHVVAEWHVTDAATAGVVKFDELYLQSTEKIPQAFTKDLPEDLSSLLNFIQAWIHSALTALGLTPSGTLLDDIFDLSDELEWIQEKAQQGAADALASLGKIQAMLDAFKGAAGGAIADIQTALNKAGQDTRDAIANALGHPGTGHTVGDILTYLMNIPKDVVDGLEDDLAEAGDAIADVFDDVRDGWNRFWDGIYKTTGSTGKTAADVQTAALEVINTATAAHVNIETANAAVATWQSAFTQQQMAQPLWLTGTDGTCEVTIPLAWCHYWPDPENGGHNSFALSCGVGAHTHAVDTIPIAIEEFKVTSMMAGINGPGQFVGGVMRCRGGDLKDTITTNGLMTSGCRFVIYEMDVTDGSVKLLYESVDQPVLGSISGGPIVHEMPAGSEFITTVGQVLVVGVWAPVDALAVLAGCPISQGYNSASSAFPKSIGVRDTGWSGNAPSTMSNGDFTYMTFETSSYADLEAATVPFFGLGSASPPAPVVRRRYVSQFATIGVSDWVNVTGPFGTINGELSSTALAAGVYKDPLATDSAATEIHLSPTRTIGKTRIAVKSNADMSKWIGVEFDRTSSTAMTAKIVTGTGPDAGLTTRFTSANVGALTDIGPYEPDPVTGETRVGGPRFRMTYDQASNTYELFKLSMYWTWDSLGTWVDSGGFTAHGLEHRYGGAVTGVNGTPNRGQPVTQVSFYDR
ncbi:hypothetical protein [Mycolicibacterium fortuitum]|uniref:hypothetical protein n=1 Tax=Mycolicibacterium fortuitum TaxID=1766 RepID=UPI00262FCA8D|nr:hypothetical protein [Mycolicibacterium fortuitum]